MPFSSKVMATWKFGKGALSTSRTTLPLSNLKSIIGPQNGLKKPDFCDSLISEKIRQDPKVLPLNLFN